MKVPEEDRRNHRPKFLKAMLDRRNKKRAPSIDATIESSSSSLDASRRTKSASPPNSQHNAVISLSKSQHNAVKSSSPIVIEEEDDCVLSENLKKDIALSNRVAALMAQQQMLGEDHPDVLFSLQNLAALHYRRGQYHEAQQVLEEQQARRDRSQYAAPLTIPHEIAFNPHS